MFHRPDGLLQYGRDLAVRHAREILHDDHCALAAGKRADCLRDALALDPIGNFGLRISGPRADFGEHVAKSALPAKPRDGRVAHARKKVPRERLRGHRTDSGPLAQREEHVVNAVARIFPIVQNCHTGIFERAPVADVDMFERFDT